MQSGENSYTFTYSISRPAFIVRLNTISISRKAFSNILQFVILILKMSIKKKNDLFLL